MRNCCKDDAGRHRHRYLCTLPLVAGCPHTYSRSAESPQVFLYSPFPGWEFLYEPSSFHTKLLRRLCDAWYLYNPPLVAGSSHANSRKGRSPQISVYSTVMSGSCQEVGGVSSPFLCEALRLSSHLGIARFL